MSNKYFISALLSFAVIASCNPSSNRNNTNSTEMVSNGADSGLSVQRELRTHDFSGTYGGILPCKDCDSVKVELVLKDDGTYQLTELHFGEEKDTVKNEGDWTFDEGKSSITLTGVKQGSRMVAKTYLVANEALTPLDKNGKAITAESGEDNVLTKQ